MVTHRPGPKPVAEKSIVYRYGFYGLAHLGHASDACKNRFAALQIVLINALVTNPKGQDR